MAVLPKLEKVHMRPELVSPLMDAILGKRSGAVRDILAGLKKSEEKAAIVNTCINNSTRESFLYWACVVGNIDAVITLVENGADFAARDYFGNTPMHVAAENGHVQVIDYLVHMFGKNKKKLREYLSMKNLENDIPLILARVNGFKDIEAKLIQASA
jgi:ankyrin repeat protein